MNSTQWLENLVLNTTSSNNVTTPAWMIDLLAFRQQVFDEFLEPVIVTLLGPVETHEYNTFKSVPTAVLPQDHRRLSGILLKRFAEYYSNESHYHTTNMTFATLFMLFICLSTVSLIFLSCFYHNQKTSPLFISPRRHRLPKLVPPPLPVDGYWNWARVILFLSDEEIINRIGYDSLIFLRFHRLALRCIVKMSVFSFLVLLPLNYTGSGTKQLDLSWHEPEGFMRFTMANVMAGSPRLWVHCFAVYLLTAIVVRELLVEYETFNSIRHLYLLNREPHLRTVLVRNIPRHLRSPQKISSYFKHVYPNAVRYVFMCQNCMDLERLVEQRTKVLSKLELELLLLCRTEKKKLYEPTLWRRCWSLLPKKLEDVGVAEGTQERLARLYSELEERNNEIEREQRRRKRVMKMLDKMEAGEGANDIDYVLASPFVTDDPKQRRLLGLSPSYAPATIPEEGEPSKSNDSGVGLDPHQLSTLPDENVASRLRSRSPAAAGGGESTSGSHKDENDESRRKSKKAKHALKRYGQVNKDMTFLGRPILGGANIQNDAKIEDHINEVTDKAFVVMRTFTAATVAIQSMHSSKPGSMQVVTAPEPRDVLWENIYVSKGAWRTRSILGDMLVYSIICFYIVPVTFISMFVSKDALVNSSPRLNQLNAASSLFSAGIQMVQPLCIVGLQQLQPPIFMAIGRMEGITSFSEVQMRTFSRYFSFQVINVFLATSISSTIFNIVALVVANPEQAFVQLGNALPKLSSFFITFVMMKTLLGLGVELVRLVAVAQAAVRYILFPTATLRGRRNLFLGCRSIDDPGWFPFHKILAQDMLVVVISVVFAVIAPLVLLPSMMFCLFSRIMWTHHHLYVYESVFESGGQFWPKIFRRFVFGLVVAQCTITGQFLLKGARHEAYATVFLIFLTYMFLRSTRARYDATSSTLPLEVATVMDISLQEEDDDPSSPRQAADPGTLIGRHDPFRQAYLQPALRADPRARPEQPFPAAQLGSNKTPPGNGDDTASEDIYQDSGATVRLKAMSLQDRKLINRWWDDQLQSAGEQNWLLVLSGEECGTLTLSDPHKASEHEFV